jgi:hypothetical protein
MECTKNIKIDRKIEMEFATVRANIVKQTRAMSGVKKTHIVIVKYKMYRKYFLFIM